MPHVFYPQDEDCLFLNVWTQRLDKSAKRPVLVWLHGGGGYSGSGIEHYAYDGEEMSRFGDAVVVTSNHRLNVPGLLRLRPTARRTRTPATPARPTWWRPLEWVRDNIACFGGDPDNASPSLARAAGAGKVVTLLQMPAADGLSPPGDHPDRRP